MYIAKWNNIEIARSNNTIEIEGNQYFPPQDVNMTYLSKTNYSTLCPWKGQAAYYSITIDGEINDNAAWYYPNPYDKAIQIKNYIAFWRGVIVEKV